MGKRYNINALQLESDIINNGFTLKEMSSIVGRNETYISQVKRSGTIDRDVLDKVCMVIRAKADDYLVEASSIAQVKSDADDKLSNIDDAIASMTKMLEQIQANTKVIADNIQTISNTNYTNGQESKRFYQTCSGFFYKATNWMKAFDRKGEN